MQRRRRNERHWEHTHTLFCCLYHLSRTYQIATATTINMQGLNLLILLVAVSSASACKYFCHKPGTLKYECCDDGNPYYEEETASESAVEGQTEEVSADCVYWCLNPNTTEYECCDDGNPFIQEDDVADANQQTNVNAQPPSNCYYYCAYDGEVYCCGDTSQPIPESHEAHEGRCPEEEEHVCKGSGIFLNSKKYPAKTSGAIRLVAGEGKGKNTCASDGYCGEEEKCCPTPCGRKHICMKSLEEDKEEKEVKEE